MSTKTNSPTKCNIICSIGDAARRRIGDAFLQHFGRHLGLGTGIERQKLHDPELGPVVGRCGAERVVPLLKINAHLVRLSSSWG
jgi:hypothetical protein